MNRIPTTLLPFICEPQARAIRHALQSEDGPAIMARLAAIAQVVETMPATYGQDGKGDQAIAYLHYFRGGMDWYITEKDMEEEQLQAFGVADLGYGPELGYICIVEIVECNVELDLYWTPCTLAACAHATA